MMILAASKEDEKMWIHLTNSLGKEKGLYMHYSQAHGKKATNATLG